MQTCAKSTLPNSAIYRGEVWHRRVQPREHAFRYRVFMLYLDLDELAQLASLSPLVSLRRKIWPASFRREDYFSIPGQENLGVAESVRLAVQRGLGFTPPGSIRLLTNLRYFGYLANPISCYYCFDTDGKTLQALLLEVTNTPWGERCHYVLDCRGDASEAIAFDKTMHVSPFMPMDMTYQWQGNCPAEQLVFSLKNFTGRPCENSETEAGGDKPEPVFSAGVRFSRVPMSAKNLNLTLIRYPLMTVKVIAGIYWQALKLFVKRLPVCPHPLRSRQQVAAGK